MTIDTYGYTLAMLAFFVAGAHYATKQWKEAVALIAIGAFLIVLGAL